MPLPSSWKGLYPGTGLAHKLNCRELSDTLHFNLWTIKNLIVSEKKVGAAKCFPEKKSLLMTFVSAPMTFVSTPDKPAGL